MGSRDLLIIRCALTQHGNKKIYRLGEGILTIYKIFDHYWFLGGEVGMASKSYDLLIIIYMLYALTHCVKARKFTKIRLVIHII